MEQTPERFVTQYTFVNKDNIMTKVYPIPLDSNNNIAWTCKCGKKAGFLIEDLICVDCLNTLISQSKLVTEKALIFPSLDKSVKSSVFEWSTNGESWYKIHGRNILYDARVVLPEYEKKKRFLDIMEKVLLSQSQSVECDYSTETKKLTILV
jgi:hypothetical protein